MEQLRDYLTAHGVFTTIRASRGQDIYAACGLLNTKRKKDNPDYSVHSDHSDYSDHSE
jgi:23S rRNA (adenine2503-C2)-methyltransferase